MPCIKIWVVPGEFRYSFALSGLFMVIYCIKAVPVTPNSFDSRKKLPVEWCGLRDQVLSEKVSY